MGVEVARTCSGGAVLLCSGESAGHPSFGHFRHPGEKVHPKPCLPLSQCLSHLLPVVFHVSLPPPKGPRGHRIGEAAHFVLRGGSAKTLDFERMISTHTAKTASVSVSMLIVPLTCSVPYVLALRSHETDHNSVR